ncbi:MAG: cell division protein SepF [Oscillospiraceae bacterium]|nr:cell division protein SepF [Oscillospiraceae bacterium]
MGLKDWFNDVFIGKDDDADDYESDGFETNEEDDLPKRTKHASASDAKKHDNKIVNINATTQLEVVLVKPERFDDASSIADHLNNKRTVVLNLESTSKEISRRLVDFLSGVAYANNGQIKRVANSTFIITPYNVGVMGDLLDELENSGVYF